MVFYMNLQSILEKNFADSTASYYVKEKNGNYAEVNQAFLDHYKLKSSKDIIGQKDIDLWNGQAPLFHINDQKVMLSQKSGVYIEDILFEKTKRFYLSCKSPLYSQVGESIGIYGVSFHLNSEQLNNSHFPEKLLELTQLLQYTNFSNEVANLNFNNSKLSPRQKDCLHYFTRGMTIKQIAKTLKLSPKTVEGYLGLLKMKLNCNNRYELVKKAFELGLV